MTDSYPFVPAEGEEAHGPRPVDSGREVASRQRSGESGRSGTGGTESADSDGPDREAGSHRRDDAASLVAVGATTLGLDATVGVLVRYVPEYLRALGVGPVGIGAFGSVWLVATRLRADDGDPSRVGLVAAALAATAGLVLWTATPVLAGGSVPAAWLAVVAGAVGVAWWARSGAEIPLGEWRAGRAAVSGPVAARPIAAALVLVGVLAVARSFLAGFRVVLALAAALAGAAAVLWTTRDAPTARRDRSRGGDAVPHLGDLLVEAALAGVATFVVLAVTTVQGLSLAVFGLRLGPAATFGLLLAAERGAAALGTAVPPRWIDAVGPGRCLLAAGVAAAAFPLLLVGLPASPLLAGAAFVVFGARSIGDVARRARPDRCPAPARRATGGRRLLALGVAPLVGGALYAVDPVLAFGAASAVGAVGVWEHARTVRAGGPDRTAAPAELTTESAARERGSAARDLPADPAPEPPGLPAGEAVESEPGGGESPDADREAGDESSDGDPRADAGRTDDPPNGTEPTDEEA